jgi:hypothetical protein
VFALFRVNVCQIDRIKKATLSQELLESLTATAPGEKLDDKLAGLAVNDGCKPFHVLFTCLAVFTPTRNLTVPPPSSDETAWWISEG